MRVVALLSRFATPSAPPMTSAPARRSSTSLKPALLLLRRLTGVRVTLWTAFTCLVLRLTGLPDMHRGIRAAGSNGFAIWRPGDGVHGPLMPRISEEGLSIRCFPHVDIAILIARGNSSAVGGPGNGKHAVDMILPPMVCEKGWFGRAIDAIGNLDGLIGASRSDEFAIRRPRQRVDFIRSVPAIAEDLVPGVEMIAMLDRRPIAQGAIP